LIDREVEKEVSRYRSLQSDRKPIDSLRENIARVMSQYQIGFQTKLTMGTDRTVDTYSNVPAMAADRLAASVESMLMPGGQNWIKISSGDEELDKRHDVASWLDKVNTAAQQFIYAPSANFQATKGEIFGSLVPFGMGAAICDQHRSGSGCHFQGLHLSNVWVDVGPDNNVDQNFVKWPVTALHAARKFKPGLLSRDTQDLLANEKFDEPIELLHVVKPRLDRKFDAIDSRNMPFESSWYEPKANHRISEGGFEESPYITPRWRTISGENYGWGPGMMVLPDANMLMQQRKALLQAGQLAALPPVIAPNEGVDINRIAPAARLLFDMETFRDLGRIPIEALNIGGSIPITREMVVDTENSIWLSFFRDLISLPEDGPQMTATEVIRRHEDKIKILGPTFGRLETELNLKLTERSVGLMFRQRLDLIEEMPEDLRDRPIDYKFTSPIQRIQEEIDAERASIVVDRLGAIAQFSPEALDKANFDAITEATLKVGPENWLRSDDEVAATREQRAEQQAQQQEVQERADDAAVTEQIGKAQQAIA